MRQGIAHSTQPLLGKDGIRGTHRETSRLSGRNGPNRGGKFHQADDGLCELMPGAIAGIRHVTNASQVAREEIFHGQSQIVRIRRTASLIPHHLEEWLLTRQPHNRLHEIIPRMSIEPGRSHHQRIGTVRQCGDFPRSLGLPIHINGMGHVLFTIGSRLSSIEDIVRRHIHQSRIERGGSSGHKRSPLSIHRQCTAGLALSPIDIGVGAGVQNDCGTGGYDLGFAVRLREVKLREIFQDEISPPRGPAEAPDLVAPAHP